MARAMTGSTTSPPSALSNIHITILTTLPVFSVSAASVQFQNRKPRYFSSQDLHVASDRDPDPTVGENSQINDALKSSEAIPGS